MHVSVLCNCVFVDLFTDVVGLLLLLLFCWYVCAFFLWTCSLFRSWLGGWGLCVFFKAVVKPAGFLTFALIFDRCMLQMCLLL